jgi:hypothetical protein
MIMGAFEIQIPDHHPENFDLRPKDAAGPIPDDQKKVSQVVYETSNVLKLLRGQGEFRKDDASFKEFIERVIEAARAGCVVQNVQTTLAAEALTQIRADVARRKIRVIVYRYLFRLAVWALVGAALGSAIVILLCELRGYGWVVIGSMVGAWISVAATRWEISFEGVQDFLDVCYEPFVRLFFVGLLASILALFLSLKVLALKIGSLDLSTFETSPGAALLVGLIAGVGERKLSVAILERARKVLTP